MKRPLKYLPGMLLLAVLGLQQYSFSSRQAYNDLLNVEQMYHQWYPGNSSVTNVVGNWLDSGARDDDDDDDNDGTETKSGQSSPFPPLFPPPPACTAQQLDIVRHQLPPDLCQGHQKRPWTNQCSFSFASSCPQAVWINEYYKHERPDREGFTAIYVGCNKGMDAVNALRMGSNDPQVDKFSWKDVFMGSGKNVKKGVCQQENAEQFPVADKQPKQPALVHCLEAMPHTATHLEWTANQFPWKDYFVVKNAALSWTDGFIGFESAQVGTETTAMCKGRSNQCTQVPMLRLDSYMASRQNVTAPSSMIDFLSIDVEGADAQVLLGASDTLKRVRYLEFEYNWKGQWKSHSLQSVVQSLQEQDFVCYWPGVGGHIWRITDCWLAHYGLHFWSNVACVHTRRHPWVAQRMEELFQQTLQHNKTIQYTARLD